MLSRRSFLDGASLLVGNLALGTMTRAGEGGEEMAVRARKFVAAHEEKVRPLERAASLAWWDANISGKDEDFAAKEEAQNRLDAALADRGRFAELKAIRSGRGSTTRPSPARSRSSSCSTWRSRSTRPC